MFNTFAALLAPTLPAEGVLMTAPWDMLHDSPFQYRRTRNEAFLDELATNIKETGGIHQPILARRRFPHPLITEYNPTDGLELVAGQCRKISGMRADLPGGPVLVKDLTDEQARRIQITENLQRQDVHAIEEAEGFQALIDNHNETADSIAKQFGKSRSYVYGRLKLLALCPEVRKACLAGEIQTEVGLLIARLRTLKLQEKALGYIRGKYIDLKDGGAQSFRSIRNLLNERFALNLGDALFDTADEVLLPSAGNCVTCPKRAANAPEYEDVATAAKAERWSGLKHGPDVCTDPDCFDAKKTAHLKREAEKLAEKAKGSKLVIDGNRARALVDAQGEVKNGYVALKSVKDELAKARQAAQRDSKIVPPQVVIIQNPRDGKTVEAVKVADLVAAGVKVKEPKKTKQSSSGYDCEEENRKREEKYRIEKEKADAERSIRLSILNAIREAVGRTERSAFDLQIVARAAYKGVGHWGRQVLPGLWGHNSIAALEKSIGQMSIADVTLFLLDCGLVEDVAVGNHDYKQPAKDLLQAANHYGVDAAEIRAILTGKASAPSTAARALKKAKAGAAAEKIDDPAALAAADAEVAKGKAKSKGKALRADQIDDAGAAGEIQTDDAGVAGGDDAQAELLEGAEA